MSVWFLHCNTERQHYRSLLGIVKLVLVVHFEILGDLKLDFESPKSLPVLRMQIWALIQIIRNGVHCPGIEHRPSFQTHVWRALAHFIIANGAIIYEYDVLTALAGQGLRDILLFFILILPAADVIGTLHLLQPTLIKDILGSQVGQSVLSRSFANSSHPGAWWK